jgi:hypothetical protein
MIDLGVVGSAAIVSDAVGSIVESRTSDPFCYWWQFGAIVINRVARGSASYINKPQPQADICI